MRMAVHSILTVTKYVYIGVIYCGLTKPCVYFVACNGTLQRAFVGSCDAFNESEIKQSESEAVAVLEVSPLSLPLRSVTTLTFVEFV